MGFADDMKKTFKELLGPEMANQIDSFDDPEKYPQDFYEECENFMAQIIGKEAAKEKLAPLRSKYLKGYSEKGNPIANRAGNSRSMLDFNDIIFSGLKNILVRNL